MIARKSTQTEKYETACFVQEAGVGANMDRGTLKILKNKSDGRSYCKFDSVLWSFAGKNRMGRWYDIENAKIVINTDPRIQKLKSINKWRGELNHPNPDIEGQRYNSIRMTIPEQTRTSHFINKDRFEGLQYKAEITTNGADTECGNQVNWEIIDNGSVPDFSVRLMGTMLPNAVNRPNMKVNKVITFDMVDFPSHEDAEADIKAVQESVDICRVIFLQDLAKYCVEQSEDLKCVCESFEISPEEIFGIRDGSIEIHQKDTSKIWIPLAKDIRKEAISIITGKGIL